MKRKALLLLMTMLAACCLAGTAFAAASGKASISVDKTTVAVGDKVSVTIAFDGEIANISGGNLAVQYDSSKFTYDRDSSAMGNAVSGGSLHASNPSVVLVGYPTSASLSNGAVATFVFTATAPGDVSFSLGSDGLYVSGGTTIAGAELISSDGGSVVVNAHQHNYDSTKHDASSHWVECSCGDKADYAGHDYGEWSVTKEATEDAAGSKARICKVCEYVETAEIPVLPRTHKYSEDFVGDLKGHWQVCLKCEAISDVVDHKYGEWTVTEEPGLFTNGSQERTCATCGYKDVEVLSATHEHTFDDASFTGDAKGHWQVCTHELCEGISEVADHEYGDWAVTEEATEDAAGSKTRACEVCEYVETAEIPALGSDSTNADSSKSDSATSSKSNLSQTGDATMVVAAGLGCLALVAAAGVVVARKKGLIG